MLHRSSATLAVICFAGSSQAALFSFEADADHSAWTFTGSGAQFADASGIDHPQVLLVDDNHGPLPPIPLWLDLQANFQISHLQTVPGCDAPFTHSYRIDGTFSLVDMLGAPVLRVTINDGVMTCQGDPLSWYDIATVRAGPDFHAGWASMEWLPPQIRGYDVQPGLYPFSSVEFALSDLNAHGPNVTLDAETHLPVANWVSEASFSGRNSNIPTPGPALILGAAGMLTISRRRPRQANAR